MTRGIPATAACVLALIGLPGPDRPVAGAAEPATLFERPAPIVAEVQRRFGDDARILSLEVWPAEAFVEVQDPRNPGHVDRYTYRDGSLTDPEPVAVGRNRRQLKARLFPVREVDLAVLPRLVGAAPGAVQAEEGRVTHAVVERSESWHSDSSWGRPRWRVHVVGPRAGGYVEYGLDGKRGRSVKW